MNVLLLERDLYRSVGGGQTVYKRLIETNPDIDFYYFGFSETAEADRPANAHLVVYQNVYPCLGLKNDFHDLGLAPWTLIDFSLAANVAASVAHLQIDVVDVPDYKSFGYFLAPALRRHGQKSCKVAMALHGNMSETQRVNWGTQDLLEVSLDQREQWQYRAADIRYGISRDYLDHWQKIGGATGHYLCPLRFVGPPKPTEWQHRQTGVALNFIGRTEGFKGPDLFLELLAWLPAGSYREARIIGPEVVDQNGVGSAVHLQRMAQRRSLQVRQQTSLNKAELAVLFAERGITVLPSRMDTFNLTALESLFAGCPVAVSSKAGVCRFLREVFPEVPFTTLDVDQLYVSAPALMNVIENYDEHRTKLIAALERAEPVVTGPGLGEIYASAASGESYLQRQAAELYDRVALITERSQSGATQRLVTAGVQACEALRKFQETANPTHATEPSLWEPYRKLFFLAEKMPRELDWKTAFCSDLSRGNRIDRARVWAELARLERMRGNDFVAATYDIRVMRAQGEDRLGLLPLVMSVLRDHGYPKEAETVFALYGPREQRLAACRKLLETARAEHRHVPDRPFKFVDDRRPAERPKVSIIVSLYRAANKLETFLRMLAQQDWVKSGKAELVFVDSNSPTDEYEVFQKLATPLGLTAVYARTEERETIQKAWNRGILLARAPYLSFLGVDEMVRPDCLPVLAGELDADPALDWVQGNSVITEVDPHGTLLRDLMIYQRIPYEQDFVYLETCYLSWVGGMYRRSIHERCGFYDETFGAAGDTEFKNRVLPFIKSKTLPRTLGVFLNYPEERTTQSPKAEVEDLRAWYLHRSAAGIEYALATRRESDAVPLLQKALGYRKSYCGHISTDLEYAWEVASFAAQRLPGRNFDEIAASIGRTLQAYRELDWLPRLTPRANVRERQRVERVAATEARRVQSLLQLTEPFTWRIFHDNRFEQHAYPWDAKALAEKFVPGTRCLWMKPKHPLAEILGQTDTPSRQEDSDDWATRSARLTAALKQQAELCRTQGKAEIARDVAVVAQHLQNLADGKEMPVANVTGAGILLCRVLAESQQGRPLAHTAQFDRRFAELCAMLAEIAAPICLELAEAFEGFATFAAQQIEQARTMELAARLLTYPSPTEAVRRHSADLTGKVLETLAHAAHNAKSGGNIPYATRLTTLANAVQEELTNRKKEPVTSATART